MSRVAMRDRQGQGLRDLCEQARQVVRAERRRTSGPIAVSLSAQGRQGTRITVSPTPDVLATVDVLWHEFGSVTVPLRGWRFDHRAPFLPLIVDKLVRGRPKAARADEQELNRHGR